MLHHDAYSEFATVHEVGSSGNVLHVFGDVDVTTAPSLASAIDDAVNGMPSIVVNLTKCRYLDSSGLTVLVRQRKRLGGRLRVLVRPASSVSRVLQIAGLDRALAVVTELSAVS